mmetsp:Transcript_59090/g.183456  ORF Transcript_59090/g.183456 Transcript_59090/m.183456 type:complete len:253 (+) Transcript_59090:140-898(+)
MHLLPDQRQHQRQNNQSPEKDCNILCGLNAAHVPRCKPRASQLTQNQLHHHLMLTYSACYRRVPCLHLRCSSREHFQRGATLDGGLVLCLLPFLLGILSLEVAVAQLVDQVLRLLRRRGCQQGNRDVGSKPHREAENGRGRVRDAEPRPPAPVARAEEVCNRETPAADDAGHRTVGVGPPPPDAQRELREVSGRRQRERPGHHAQDVRRLCRGQRGRQHGDDDQQDTAHQHAAARWGLVVDEPKVYVVGEGV